MMECAKCSTIMREREKQDVIIDVARPVGAYGWTGGEFEKTQHL